MQCALFLSFSPWCFTSPKVIFFFLPCSEALQLQTLPWCLSGKHRKLNYRKKKTKASKKNSLDYSDSTKIHLSAGRVHIKQMCPLAPVIYLGNCELTGIKWPLQGSAAVMSARDRVVLTSRDDHVYVVWVAVLHCGLIAGKGAGRSLWCEALLVKLIVLRISLSAEWAGFPRKALTGAWAIARGKTQGTRPRTSFSSC